MLDGDFRFLQFPNDPNDEETYKFSTGSINYFSLCTTICLKFLLLNEATCIKLSFISFSHPSVAFLIFFCLFWSLLCSFLLSYCMAFLKSCSISISFFKPYYYFFFFFSSWKWYYYFKNSVQFSFLHRCPVYHSFCFSPHVSPLCPSSHPPPSFLSVPWDLRKKRS